MNAARIGLHKYCNGYNFKANFILGDGADCIFNASHQVWPNITYLLYFFHLKKSIRSHITKQKNNEIKQILVTNFALIDYCINLLSDTKSKSEFDGYGN